MPKPQRRSTRYVETSNFLAAVARMLRAAGRRVGDADIEELRDLLAMQAELDRTIVQAVAGLRAAGVTWQQIGEANGTTGQAATIRWKARIDQLDQGAPRQAAS